ncbi:hypothetical protein PHLCEN_2v1184 [Hermanssonia centrifuga]|uniref:Uncharacterized protein n=1 Tax=Hermanssonia centrifuga TaxID=98765 RepID=A0A2R6S3W0_9APHY|nr:hypothetical protein PHLCEN_2v1184 [Hermanssonia centrifuga]
MANSEDIPSDAPPSFSAETYFATQPPPPTLEEDVSRVLDFIQRQREAKRKVVLVTPFSRHYSHSTHPFLDFLDHDSSEISVKPSERPQLLSVLSAYKEVQKSGTLHTLTFVTVDDYLWLLRAVSQELSILGRDAMFYLAAAVSDFFLPRQKMSEHKIQSGKGSLHIEMDQVPKILKPLVNEWTREGYIVSFKVLFIYWSTVRAINHISSQLETDQVLLVPKARAALARYGHQVVIGNDLHRRKFEVVFVSPVGGRPIQEEPNAVQFTESWLNIDLTQDPTKEIEEDIVAELVRRHRVWTGDECH